MGSRGKAVVLRIEKNKASGGGGHIPRKSDDQKGL